MGLIGHGKWNSRILHEFCIGEKNAATDSTDLFAGVFHAHHDFGESGQKELNVIGVLGIEVFGEEKQAAKSVFFAHHVQREDGFHEERGQIAQEVGDYEVGVVFADAEQTEIDAFLQNWSSCVA